MKSTMLKRRVNQVIAFAALLGMSSAIAQPVAADDYASRVGNAAVVARSGGFPTLEPVSPDARRRSRGGSIEQPAYRVAESDADSIDRHGSRSAESANAAGNEGLALPTNPESSRSKMMAPLVTVASSLAIVLALFSALVWTGRKFGGRASGSKPLPAAALTPLGHVMLDPRTKLLLVKCGRRILVLSQTASGITPITEVTHPDEVRELMASCSAEARDEFQRTLREVEMETARDFTDAPPPPTARQSGRLFATA